MMVAFGAADLPPWQGTHVSGAVSGWSTWAVVVPTAASHRTGITLLADSRRHGRHMLWLSCAARAPNYEKILTIQLGHPSS